MTAITLTAFEGATPGLKMGSCSLANAYTSKFGFQNCSGVVLTLASGTGTATIGHSISSGTVTVTANEVGETGTAITTATTCNYIAWGRG